MSKKREPLQYDYWDIIEAALTCVPETNPLRADGLAAFDHLKERVTGGRPPVGADPKDAQA